MDGPIPKALRHRLKLHCVMQDVSITELATAAIAEKLRREREPRKKKRRRRTEMTYKGRMNGEEDEEAGSSQEGLNGTSREEA